MARLKAEINVADPTLDDVKKIMTLIADYTKAKTVSLTDEFKRDRRKRFPKHERFHRMADYMHCAQEGMMKLQQTVMQLQQEQQQLLAQVGISQASFMKFGPQLGEFMQKLTFSSDVGVLEAREALKLKTEYLQVKGPSVTEKLVELCASLSMQEKQFIPLFLNVIMSDEIFENEPALDREEVDVAAGTIGGIQSSTKSSWPQS